MGRTIGAVVAKKKTADRTSLPTAITNLFGLLFVLVVDQPEISRPKPQFFVSHLVAQFAKRQAQLFGNVQLSQQLTVLL